MSVLEETINLLRTLPENQIEMICGFVQFLSSKQMKEKLAEDLSEAIQESNSIDSISNTENTLEK